MSDIKEIKEMMSRLDAEPDGNASRRSLELAEEGGQDSDMCHESLVEIFLLLLRHYYLPSLANL